MTSPILTSSYNYDNRAQRWRDSASGKFLSGDAVNAEMFRHSDATHSTLESLTRQLYDKQISLSQWQIAVASELKDAHLAQAMFAAGGRNKFAADIASGKVSEAMALSRVAHYGDSSKASYWNEYIERSDGLLDWNDVPDDRECDVCPQIAAGGPYTKETIPSSPGDGKTPCKGRCRCTVSRRGER
jgi:hypothetical protein